MVKFNYQSGLRFYFTRHGHVVSFLVQEIGDRKRKIRVRMEPDVNHERPHVHIDEHGASFDVKTGELMEGKCDARTQHTMREWILRHRKDLLELWDIAKDGRDYRPIIQRIREDKDFADYGFKDEKPENYILVDGVRIWHEGELIQEIDAQDVRHIVAEGNMYVVLPVGYQEGSMTFESVNGKVRIKYR